MDYAKDCCGERPDISYIDGVLSLRGSCRAPAYEIKCRVCNRGVHVDDDSLQVDGAAYSRAIELWNAGESPRVEEV